MSRENVPKTILWFFLFSLMVYGIGYGFGSADSSWRKYRIELYAGMLPYYLYATTVELVARHIYRHETVQGRQREQQRQQRLHRIADNSAASPPIQVVIRRGPRYSLVGVVRRVVRPFRHNLWVLGSLIVPTLYVHLISSLGVITSMWSVWILTALSVVLKVAMQETAKSIILRRNIHNSRTMVIMVAMPTVLIDTQVRIVFLRFQSTQMTLSTALVMAAMEICMRVSKSLLLRWQIQMRQASLMKRSAATAVVTHTDESESVKKRAATVSHADELEFTECKAQLHHYHTTELMADMYAEYLAIGCSSVITLIMGTHPQFLLQSIASSSSSSGSVYWQLPLQVAVEAIVDYVSCFMEIANGLSFDFAEKERGFYLAVFISIAVVNVDLSAVLYMAY